MQDLANLSICFGIEICGNSSLLDGCTEFKDEKKPLRTKKPLKCFFIRFEIGQASVEA
jgi:hypothetical protein